MASLFIGTTRGALFLDNSAISTGSTTTGTGRDIELRIDLTKGWDSMDLFVALRAFETYLISNQNLLLQGAGQA
jgi:hypothetical protein